MIEVWSIWIFSDHSCIGNLIIECKKKAIYFLRYFLSRPWLYTSSRDCFNAASIIIMGNYGSIFYWVFQVRSRKEEGRSLNRGDGLRN